ncbi:hypothetical protein [Nocardioides panzhihuensis]|uniref:Heparin binding hemagglutinin HbhA n=1 Tax=Nocardioides panzhihuensis TaxID=860243 RepID=A0A7Z0DPT5_9ACTN|nr:hypothetical protein [Nocardioides panzhihuensis]NYI79544.1 heparin binding hemagglutinin HbhA [Nocardioides panzhihuensis]
MPTLPKIETTKPLNAVAGVADLAYETVKGYATDIQKRVDGYRSEATTKLTDARTKATEKATAAKTTVTGFNPKTLPALAKEQYAVLPEKVKVTVKSKLDETTDSATGTYDKLATRGETFVAKLKKTEIVAESPAAPAPAAASPEAPAKQAPAKKAPAKKAPAKKAGTTNAKA